MEREDKDRAASPSRRTPPADAPDRATPPAGSSTGASPGARGSRPVVIRPRVALVTLLVAIGLFLQAMSWVVAAHLGEHTGWVWAMVVGGLLCAAAFVAVGVLVADLLAVGAEPPAPARRQVPERPAGRTAEPVG